MTLVKQVKNAYLFFNGNLACFDINGNQITELQGTYSIDMHKRILLEALDDCNFIGFEILPNGFGFHASQWADYFRKHNMSYDEIINL